MKYLLVGAFFFCSLFSFAQKVKLLDLFVSNSKEESVYIGNSFREYFMKNCIPSKSKLSKYQGIVYVKFEFTQDDRILVKRCYEELFHSKSGKAVSELIFSKFFKKKLNEKSNDKLKLILNPHLIKYKREREFVVAISCGFNAKIYQSSIKGSTLEKRHGSVEFNQYIDSKTSEELIRSYDQNVYVNYVVEKDGSISNLSIRNEDKLPEEIIREVNSVMNNVPKRKLLKSRNRLVRYRGTSVFEYEIPQPNKEMSLYLIKRPSYRELLFLENRNYQDFYKFISSAQIKSADLNDTKRVLVSFVLNRLHAITEIEFLSSIPKAYEEEAIRLLKSYEYWNFETNSKKVRIAFNLGRAAKNIFPNVLFSEKDTLIYNGYNDELFYPKNDKEDLIGCISSISEIMDSGEKISKMELEGVLEKNSTINQLTINSGIKKIDTCCKKEMNQCLELNWSAPIFKGEIVRSELNLSLSFESLIYTFSGIESSPEYKGGTNKMYQFLARNIKYPKIAKITGIQGRVYLMFTVTKEGKLENIKVVRDIGGGCGEEAVRVIKMMPEWIPGVVDGERKDMQLTLPINFKLE